MMMMMTNNKHRHHQCDGRCHVQDSELPGVLIALFIEEPTPFLENFFADVLALNYPSERIHLLLHNAIEFHDKQTAQFVEEARKRNYASLTQIPIGENTIAATVKTTTAQQRAMSEWEARQWALGQCKQLNCDYLLALDSVARLEYADTLRVLIETNKLVVAPALSRPRKLWSNFWGSITSEGYYSRSFDYAELVMGERTGVWNVPHVMNAYLIDGKFLRATIEAEPTPQAVSLASAANEIDDHHQQQSQSKQPVPSEAAPPRGGTLSYFDANYPTVKPSLIFSRNLRLANVFQFVSNEHDFGHLVDPSNYNTSAFHADFYQLANNMLDWERKYMHENYSKLIEDEQPDNRLESPCQDVYWFPLVSDTFCRHVIEIMENFGRWSGGTNNDPRIEGGYESVPTRDIHFKQVGLHEMWLTFLREYVMPVQLKEYIGYEHDPPRTDLAFVVRYHPSEQPSLRPHHDSSTYTLNIALNEPGKDYEGGGCRFVRYNCSVTESRRGWALIHPGRLTHYHEGLPVTNGTRYILVTFVDP